jgi:carbamoyltransferase
VSYVAFPGITYSNIENILESYFKFHFGYCPKVKLVDHHMAHAASVFYTSGFDESMIITADLTGEGKSTILCYGVDDKIAVLKEFKVPNSQGIFYSMVTQYLGFKRDSEEYKVMGLSAYGTSDAVKDYDFSWLLRLRHNNDGGDADYSLNTEYLRLNENNRTPPRQEPLYSEKFLSKLPVPRRLPHMPIDGHYKDIAKSALGVSSPSDPVLTSPARSYQGIQLESYLLQTIVCQLRE